MLILKEYITKNKEIILYNGKPNFEQLEKLSEGVGDIWHSSFEQGFKNLFLELRYQTATFFWYLKDFDNLNTCVSWRINPFNFAVRKSVWEALGGFDEDDTNTQMQALQFGLNALRYCGAIPLYAQGLFEESNNQTVEITAKDRYTFFIKNFKIQHAIYMLFRRGFFNFNELVAFLFAKRKFSYKNIKQKIPARKLLPLKGFPTVSYIIPTMMRQDFTLNLLEDLKNQSYQVTQVIIVDATPIESRNETIYFEKEYPFELIVKWQTTKGSCRARNEAIELCTGDYIIFGDDDLRLAKNYVENHLRFLQTYNSFACNGLDVRADHQNQNLEDLENKLLKLGDRTSLAGATQFYNNANNCVRRDYVAKVVGNDVNFDGGYGEDNDFGLTLVKNGVIVLQNPYAHSLHLKPPLGGYRFWGDQSKILGKKRKKQPWELDTPVKWIRPVPSPTVMYFNFKHFGKELVIEYKYKYLFIYLFKGAKVSFPLRLLYLPMKILQFNKSVFYAKKLLNLGVKYK